MIELLLNVLGDFIGAVGKKIIMVFFDKSKYQALEYLVGVLLFVLIIFIIALFNSLV